MRRTSFGRFAMALLLAITLALGLVNPALAQQNDAASEPDVRPEVVAMMPLLIDLFRSTPAGTAAPNPPQAISTPQGGDGPQGAPLAGSGPVGAPVAVSGAFVPDEVLVTINGNAEAVQDIAAALGLQVRSVRTSFLLGTSVARFGIPDGRPVGAVLAQINQDGRAAGSEPNHVYTLQQSGSVGGYALETINFNPADTDGSNIRLAVIDTARDKKHPALSGISAEDFDALPETPVSNTDHGTSIVGLIAGQNGFQGVAPKARILHARAFENGKSNADAILAALDWAAEQNAQIINMSFVGPRNKLFELACNAALDRGILLVAAAGNNGPKAPPAFPGAYKSVVAVTATDEQNRRMAQANVGNYIAISAPGVGVLAPIPGGGFDAVTGTSFAAAIYSGAIANLMQKDPALSAFEIERKATKTALDLGAKGKDAEFGYGLLDFRTALSTFGK